MSRRAIFVLPLLIVPVIIGGILGGLWFLAPRLASLPTTAVAPAPSPQNTTDQPVAAGNTQQAPVPTMRPEQTAEFDAEDQLLTRLFQERSPAVVAIRIQGNDPNAPDSPFIFPSPEGSGEAEPEGSGEAQPEFNFEAAGSGFLFDDQGHIATNNHVVENAKLIEVSFTNGLTVEATVVGTDPDSDIAVLKVEQLPEGVRPLPFGDSKQVLVGQRAVAIGNPFSLQTTLTTGVVSARGRTVENRRASNGGVYSIADIIQTDAAINPGNSGGPLFNSRGEVIGINTAIRSEGGSFEGIGFAVPSNTVKKVTKALIETGRYEHPYLGIRFGNPLTLAVAKQLNLPVNQGIFVGEVVSDGPAGKAGLRASTDDADAVIINGYRYPTKSDIILKIDGQQVSNSEQVIDYLATDTEVGQTVTLTILRDGKEQELKVTLGARPRD